MAGTLEVEERAWTLLVAAGVEGVAAGYEGVAWVLSVSDPESFPAYGTADYLHRPLPGPVLLNATLGQC